MDRYIKDLFSGEYKWVRDEPKKAPKPKPAPSRGLYFIPDIEPYTSVIDGSTIDGRRQHRDHLRAHECFEVGNEKIRAKEPEPIRHAGHDIKEAMEKLAAGYRPARLDTYKEELD